MVGNLDLLTEINNRKVSALRKGKNVVPQLCESDMKMACLSCLSKKFEL